jgi:hypothetical protein
MAQEDSETDKKSLKRFRQPWVEHVVRQLETIKARQEKERK